MVTQSCIVSSTVRKKCRNVKYVLKITRLPCYLFSFTCGSAWTLDSLKLYPHRQRQRQRPMLVYGDAWKFIPDTFPSITIDQHWLLTLTLLLTLGVGGPLAWILTNCIRVLTKTIDVLDTTGNGRHIICCPSLKLSALTSLNCLQQRTSARLSKD